MTIWYVSTSQHECKTSRYYAENIINIPAAADPDVLIDWLRDRDDGPTLTPTLKGAIIV